MTDPSHPDLTSKAGRKAFRREMRMIAVRPRRWGLWLLAIGTMLMIAPSAFGIHSLAGWSPSLLGMVLIVAAIPLLSVAAMARRRYRRGLTGISRGDG